MELKVWVEGIQRVICGVTEVTTCQDVVLALAHATGKTGRFTLIERWRDNERFLAPAENPLKVLQKWGEYATDVQFILRQSDKTRTSVRYSDKFTNNFTPHQPTRSSLKKSLTFSGAHNSPGPPNIYQQRANGRIRDQSIDSINEHTSNISHGSHSTASPFQSLERRKPSPAIVTSSNGSLDRRVIGHSSRDRPITGGGEIGSNNLAPRAGSFSSTQLTPREQRRDQISPGRTNTRPNQPSPLTHGHLPSPSRGSEYSGGKVEVYDLDSYWKNSNGQVSVDQHSTSHIYSPTQNDVNTHNGRHSSREINGDQQRPVGDSTAAKRQDLLHLIKLQQQELNEQKMKLEKSDSETVFLEKRDQDLTKQAHSLEEEIKRIADKERDISEEVAELDIVSWVDKLEIEKHNEQVLQNEIKTIRTNISMFESDIKTNKMKSQNITSDMDKEKQEQIIWKKKEKEENERKTEMELQRLKKVLEQKVKEFEDSEANFEKLEVERKELDNDLERKSGILADLETELKEFNMEQFQDELLPSALEGSTQISHQRSLSSSRAGSARQLTFNLQRLRETVSNSKDKDVNWV